MLSSRKLAALEETASTIIGETATFAANAGDTAQARGVWKPRSKGSEG